MDILTIISFATLAYCLFALYKRPKEWSWYVQIVPAIVFMLYAEVNGLKHEAWIHAFTPAGLLALGAIVFSLQQRILMNRLFLGVNYFLLLGAIGFSFEIMPLVKWYSMSNSGPFFSCIAAVGLLTTLFTPSGFLGKKGLKKDAVRYGSFLLLAATFVALIWSVQQDAQGMFWAVIAPFLVLLFLQYQMKQHIS